jgi:AraC-like DNA-binding protein
MPDLSFKLNPPARELPTCSAVLNGVANRYTVASYRTTLSIKAVIRGAALYTTRQARHLVTDDSFLILNEGQEYGLEFQWPGQTETLCPFFQPTFVEQVAHSWSRADSNQLDDPDQPAPARGLYERLYPCSGSVGRLLKKLHVGIKRAHASGPWLEDRFFELAESLIQLNANVAKEVDNIRAIRPSTRQELYRRLHRGRDCLSSCYSSPLTVSTAARAAKLSPAHFHRRFRDLFRQTPMQFLQDRRLTAARSLLTRTVEPVTNVCFLVGFESLGSFSSLFRRRFGCSPGRYRKLHSAARN